MTHVCVQSIETIEGTARHQIEAGVGGRLAVEVQHVEMIEPARQQTMPGLEPGIQLAAEPRQIEVARSPQIRPELRAQQAAHDALADREVVGEQEVLGVDVAPVGKRPAGPVRVRRQAQNAAVHERHTRRHEASRH